MKLSFLLLAFGLGWASFGVAADLSGAPEPCEELQLWLEATDYAGDRWKDRSGKGHHASQGADATRPARVDRAINGLPAVRFQPQHRLECGNFMAGSTAITVFAVVAEPARRETAFVIAAKHGTWAAADGEWVYRLTQPQSSSLQQEFFANQTAAGYLSSSAVIATGATDFVACSMRWKADSQPVFATLGSVMEASHSKWNTLRALPKTAYPLTIGTVEGLNTGRGGDLAELIIYDTALSDERTARINGYLKRKYFTRQVVFDGNSLTIGTGISRPYPSQVLAKLDGQWAAYNLGVNRQTSSQMAADAVAQVDALLEPGFETNVLVAWEITNDMAFGTKTAQACYEDYAAYCAARKAAGFKVIALTVLPRGDGAREDFEGNRLQVNDWIRKKYATFADAVADVAADPRIGSAGAPLDPNYFTPDKVHLNDAGAGVVAAKVIETIDSL